MISKNLKFMMSYRSTLFALAVSLCLTTPIAHAVTCAPGLQPNNPDASYTDHGDGTVTHVPTGLMWKRCSEGQIWTGSTCTGTDSVETWAQALTLASASSFAGQMDWRLPDIKELRSLVEECRFAPPINDIIFPAASSSNFWSGSPDANGLSLALGVSFHEGDSNSYERVRFLGVRLVRGGQSFDSSAVPSSQLALLVTPPALDFGTTTVGTTSAEKTVTLTNPGNDVLISAIGIAGEFTNRSTAPPGYCTSGGILLPEQWATCARSSGVCYGGKILAAGSSCTLALAFAPTTVGSKAGSLSISSAGTAYVVPLTGNQGQAPLPDLIVSALTAPSLGTLGAGIEIAVTVTNQGTVSSAASRLGLYFSADSSITTSDILVASCSTPILAAGGSNSCSGAVMIPASLIAGNHYFGAIVDSLAVVSESSEANNTRSSAIVVSASTAAIPVVKAVYPKSSSDVSEIMQGGQVMRWYALESTTGAALSNQTVQYQIAGEVVKSSATDENGLFWIESDRQINLTGNNSREVSVNFIGMGNQTFSLKIAARSIEQTWVAEAKITAEAGVGPQVGLEANLAKIGPMAYAGVKSKLGMGGVYAINMVYKSNISDDKYIYSTVVDNLANRSISFSEAFSLNTTLGSAAEVSFGFRLAAKKKFGVEGTVGLGVVSSIVTTNTYDFPNFFSTVSPVGPCHLGWRLVEQLVPKIGFLYTGDLGVAPSYWLCGEQFLSFQTESKSSSVVGVNALAGVKLNLNILNNNENNTATNSILSKINLTAQQDGSILLTRELVDKYKKKVLDSREDKLEVVYVGTVKQTIGGSLKRYYGALGKTWAGNLELGGISTKERKGSITEIYDKSRNFTGVKWQSTLANSSAGSVSAGAGILSNWSGADTVEDNLAVETTDVADAFKFQAIRLESLVEFKSDDVENALDAVMSPVTGAAVAPVKYSLTQERRLTPFDIPFDLGAAFGVSLKVGAGIKISASDKYLKAKGVIVDVILAGQPKRLKFATENYEESDGYLSAQAQSPTIVVKQMEKAVENFAAKLFTSDSQVVSNIELATKVVLEDALNRVSEFNVVIGELGSRVSLTIEKWVSELSSSQSKIQASPISRALGIVTQDRETAIGPIHFVNVQTGIGAEIDALARPGSLTIGNVSQYLTAAGLSASTASQIALYRVDTETRTKTFVGGNYTAASDQLVASLNRTGAYIMVVDTKAPNLEDGLHMVLDAVTGGLKVSAVLSQDLSGIDPSKISLSVNGVSILNATQWQTYFNPLTNSFEVLVPREKMAIGTNQIVFGAKDVAANSFNFATQFFAAGFGSTLNVHVFGLGSVSGSPEGINCGSVCSASFASGTSVTLTATPATGSTFSRWSGACTGTGACTVTMAATQNVIATFATAAPATFTLGLIRIGTGSGTVSSVNGLGSTAEVISCGTRCSAAYNAGTSVTLYSLSHAGSVFTGWGGACSGSGIGSCIVSMTAAKSVTATFTLDAPKPVCTVNASPASIAAGSASTLTASCTPSATSYTWTGGTCAGKTTSQCVATPSVNTSYSVAGVNAAGSGVAASATVNIALAGSPVCTLRAAPVVLSAGARATLTASCSPEATSYLWTNSGFGSATSTGAVAPTKPTMYSVVGVNAAGQGVAATTAVYVCNTPPSDGYPGQMLTGSTTNDQLPSGIGSDTIDGGPGFDVVMYQCNRSNFTVTRTTSGWTVSSAAEGLDTLSNVERIQFGNETLALDISGNAGQAYRIYQAAFDRIPDNGGLKYWINQMDAGISLEAVAAGFVNSAEFQALYGTSPTNAEFLTKLYQNVLHRTPDQGGYDWWLGHLNAGRLSRVTVLASFSESPENQAGVLGAILNGIDLLN